MMPSRVAPIAVINCMQLILFVVHFNVWNIKYQSYGMILSGIDKWPKGS